VNPYAPPYPQIVDASYSALNGGSLDVMSDIVTPKFQSIKSEGGIVNSPMKKTFYSYSWPSLVIYDTLYLPVNQVGIYSTYSGSLFSIWDDPTGVRKYTDGSYFYLKGFRRVTNNDSVVKIRAAVDARNKINPVLVQSIVSLAELRKTVRLVTNLARTLVKLGTAIRSSGTNEQIYDLINGVKKGNLGHAKRALLGGSSRYLEYRYGIRILILEIQGVLKALHNVRQVKPRYTARSTKNIYSEYVGSKTYQYSLSGTDVHGIRSSEDVTARAFVMYEADLKHQHARDWGYYELPLAAWELIPYSFVIDWIIPIGAWLEAITPKAGVKILAEGLTIKTIRSVEREVLSHADPISGSTRYSLSGHVGSIDYYQEETKERIVGLSQQLNRPYVDVKLNVARALDAIALLVTAGRGLGSSIRR
jgi:hypothetical protein